MVIGPSMDHLHFLAMGYNVLEWKQKLCSSLSSVVVTSITKRGVVMEARPMPESRRMGGIG